MWLRTVSRENGRLQHVMDEWHIKQVIMGFRRLCASIVVRFCVRGTLFEEENKGHSRLANAIVALYSARIGDWPS